MYRSRSATSPASVPAGIGGGAGWTSRRSAGGQRVAAAPGRLHYLDNLRACLTVLVVVHHAALAYGTVPVWPNREPPPDPGTALPLDLFVLLNQAFFMGLFFLLAGFFAPASADRKGSRTFALDRLTRLGLPFLGYLVLVRPLYTLPVYLGAPAAERQPYWRFYLTEAAMGPGWFLEVLLVFCLAYACWHAWSSRTGRPAPVSAPPRARQILAFATVLGVASYLWRMVIPFGVYLPIAGLPSGAFLPQYVALFTVYAVAFRRGWLTSPAWRGGRLGLGLVALSAVPLALGGYRALMPATVRGTADLAHLGFALWDSLFACGVALLLLAGFRRFAAGSNAVTRFASANAFGAYLIHAPIIVCAVWLFSAVRIVPTVKALLVFVICAAASWALTALMRRIPAVRGVL